MVSRNSGISMKNPPPQFKIGDHVECALSEEECRKHEASDERKAAMRGVRFFIGNGAARMHRDEAYVIEKITKTGGLKLRGFAPTVSSKDVRLSQLPNYR